MRLVSLVVIARVVDETFGLSLHGQRVELGWVSSFFIAWVGDGTFVDERVDLSYQDGSP